MNNLVGTRLEFELKDSYRGFWNIVVTSRGQLESTEEEDYFETFWDVKITTELVQPTYNIEFIISTQYDTTITKLDIAKEVHNHIMRLYDSLLTSG